MTALEQLGAFVATHQPDERACADARLHAADTIGAWIARRGTAEGRALLAFRKDADAAAPIACAINVALARLSEIDDIHLAAMITPGAIVVPAALTIAASLPDAERPTTRRGHRRGLRGDDPARRSRSTGRACSIAASGRPISRRRSASPRSRRG